MEYYYVVANYTGRLTFVWSEKCNNKSMESQGMSGNFYYSSRLGTLGYYMYFAKAFDTVPLK